MLIKCLIENFAENRKNVTFLSSDIILVFSLIGQLSLIHQQTTLMPDEKKKPWQIQTHRQTTFARRYPIKIALSHSKRK